MVKRNLAAERDEGLRMLTTMTQTLAGGGVVAAVGLAVSFAHAIPGHAKVQPTQGGALVGGGTNAPVTVAPPPDSGGGAGQAQQPPTVAPPAQQPIVASGGS